MQKILIEDFGFILLSSMLFLLIGNEGLNTDAKWMLTHVYKMKNTSLRFS